MTFTYNYEMASISVDCVLFKCVEGKDLQVLLIERGEEPHKGMLATVGGFVERHEDTHSAAIRELKEEAHLDVPTLTFIGIADQPYRDPRQRTLSCIYSCVISEKLSEQVKAGDDAVDFRWVNMEDIYTQKVKLAFDHYDIIMRSAREFGRLNRVG